MRRSICLSLALVVGIAGVGLLRFADKAPSSRPETVSSKAEGVRLLQRQPAGFIPNLGQWKHPAKFVHRSGAMTLFVESRGWRLNLVARSSGAEEESPGGAGLRMTFEGDATVPEIVGEKKFGGHHNYFVGNDEKRWRTGVPLYASVRYEDLYPGIDLRLREAEGVPEYDLLLEPGADLSRVAMHVDGAKGLSIADDGSLVIDTAVGPLTQSVPKTWQVGTDGAKREVVCNFILLGAERFGFTAPGWDRETMLTIDPGLIYSTFLGGGKWENGQGFSVDASGVVTVWTGTNSSDFPTTPGAYDTTHNGGNDVSISRLDPRKTGNAQLVYSTYLGGSGHDGLFGQFGWTAVDASGVVTMVGQTTSTDFPTTSNAYDRTFNGGNNDRFVCRLDPSKTGGGQLVSSTYLGGSGDEIIAPVSVDGSGVVTMVGQTTSTDFPTTPGAYDGTFNGGNNDAFVSRLDLSKTGNAQLVYSTYLGGSGQDGQPGGRFGVASVDASGVVTMVGQTTSTDFPTTPGAYDRTYNGGGDLTITRVDPRRTGSAQLVYSTFLGGSRVEGPVKLAVDASGVVTMVGETTSTDFPTTPGAFDRTYNGSGDLTTTRVDPSKTGSAQLVYSTYLGGSGKDFQEGVGSASVDSSGVVTMVGQTYSTDFPTTPGAYDRTYGGGPGDLTITRVDPRQTGNAQLVYSTYLGDIGQEYNSRLAVDASGVVTLGGNTDSFNFPTTPGAYDRTYNGSAFTANDHFVTRLSMGVALYADTHELSLKTAGTQNLTLEPGKQHAGKSYWIYGSFGTTPGINLGGVRIPLNPDPYTYLALALTNSSMYQRFSGTLDGNGQATAALNPPTITQTIVPFTVYHAYVVYDGQGIYMASNAVPLGLTN